MTSRSVAMLLCATVVAFSAGWSAAEMGVGPDVVDTPASKDNASPRPERNGSELRRSAVPIFKRGDCPPEMAKSDAPCAASRVKAAARGGFHIGDKIPAEDVHVVTRPGLYGIGAAPRGSLYGIIDGRLVRYNPETMRIQSVIRYVEAILD